IEMRTVCNRSLCRLSDSTTSEVLQLEARPSFRGGRCTHQIAGSTESLRFPSILPYRISTEEVRTQLSMSIDYNCVRMANPAVVPAAARALNGPPYTPAVFETSYEFD